MVKDGAYNERRIDYWERKGFPHSVAKMQSAWERRQAIVRMRDQGMTYVAIANTLHITPARIAEIVVTTRNHPQHRKPPVMDWLDYCGPIHRLKSSKQSLRLLDRMAVRQHNRRDWLFI